jgi:hypothetical protein
LLKVLETSHYKGGAVEISLVSYFEPCYFFLVVT